MTVLDHLATTIRELAHHLWVSQARVADITEVDVLGRALVALHTQIPPDNPLGDYAIAYWENRIALLLTMQEAITILALRRRGDLTTRVYLDRLTAWITLLYDDARCQRRIVQTHRFTKEP